jgi:tetratricopeptide (TPR) repeat protein
MKSHRAIWYITAATVALAVCAFGLREMVGGRALSPRVSERVERDRVVEAMMVALDRDPRVRLGETRRWVEQAAAYCAEESMTTAETLYALGLREFYGESDAEGAREAFTRSRQARPDWAWPVNGLAIVEYVTGERDAAMATFEEAMRLAPAWSRPHADLAILLRRSGEMGEALRHAKLALEVEPGHPINHYNYGVILDELGRHADARREYLAAIAIMPDLPQAHYNLACGFAREGDVAGALGPLDRAIGLEPRFLEEALSDPDFDRVREDTRFTTLVQKP